MKEFEQRYMEQTDKRLKGEGNRTHRSDNSSIRSDLALLAIDQPELASLLERIFERANEADYRSYLGKELFE